MSIVAAAVSFALKRSASSSTVADRSRGALVEVNDVITLKKTLTMCVATIRPPYPPQLWLKVQIKVPRGKGFGKCPVAVRGAVLRDDTPIQDFGAVVAEEVIITEPESGARLSPDTFEVNALAGLEAPPETMLIHARAEALLMPEGTDVASVDPETVRVDPGDTTTLLSNPVRINFAPEAAAQ